MPSTKLQIPNADMLLAATVKAQTAADDVRHHVGQRLDRAVRSAEQRLAERVDAEDDTGAQAAEYAMMTGVGVAIVAAIVAFLRRGDIIQSLVTALVEVLISFVQSWFSG